MPKAYRLSNSGLKVAFTRDEWNGWRSGLAERGWWAAKGAWPAAVRMPSPRGYFEFDARGNLVDKEPDGDWDGPEVVAFSQDLQAVAGVPVGGHHGRLARHGKQRGPRPSACRSVKSGRFIRCAGRRRRG